MSLSPMAWAPETVRWNVAVSRNGKEVKIQASSDNELNMNGCTKRFVTYDRSAVGMITAGFHDEPVRELIKAVLHYPMQ